LRLGFVRDGEAEIGGERFLRYRLYAPAASRPGRSGRVEGLWAGKA